MSKSYNFSRNKAKGFAMPIVLAFGVLMLLIGLTMVLRSQRDRMTNSSQNTVVQAQAISESGIAIEQNFINANRSIATSNACNNWNPDGSCDDTTGTSWATTTSPPIIAAAATRVWQDISSSDPTQGQYRLIDYTFSNAAPPPGTLGTGTLVVEGRVKQIGSGPTAPSNTATSTIRLSMTMNVVTATASGFPGLWVQTGTRTSASGSAAVKTAFQDSSPGGAATTNLSNPASVLAQATSISATPGLGFPPLPGGGVFIPPPTGSGVYAIPGGISLSGSNTMTLPQSGDTPNSSNVYTYNIGSSGNVINLSGSSSITVGTGSGDTVALYLNGGLQVSGGTAIKVTPRSKMILYVNGGVQMSGGSSFPAIINNNADGSLGGVQNAQIYVYGSQTIQLSGSSNMSAFIFGPNSAVQMSGSTNFSSAVWANSWNASGSASVTNATVDPSQLLVQSPGSSVIIVPPT